ncbi:MAG: amino acid adenylation domain-containing protein, partial [Gammaproteobacteria bacterium]|nr:amino acid adenylation domain-containing protein [Gammaproteobacteria bacterium]
MNTSDTKYKTGQITGQITGKVTGQAEHYEFPVSFAQQRLWFLDQLEGSSAVYNIRLPVLLKGELDVDCLQSAVDQVVARHETLRTRFQVREGVPVQVISEQAYVGITRHDMSVVSTETLQKAVGRLAAEPFDLSSDSLFRVHLLRLSDHEHLLLLLCHHIISDAWSSGILFRDLAAAYDAGVANGQPEWPELTVQYADYTVWQRTWLEGPELERQLQFWREALKGVPAESTLSPDFSRPTRQSFNGSRHAHVLPEALATDLTRLAQSESCTLFMLLFAVFNVLIFRYTGQDDLCIGSPIAGRRRSELEGLVGLFVNTLVLRTDLSGDPCFTELLAQVRKTALAGFGHQELPFEKLVEALQPERDASRSPLFQIMFILQNAPWEARPIKGLEVEPGVAGDTTTSKFDVTVAAHEYEGELWINFEYNTDLFEVRTIEQLGCCFESLLRSVVAAPDTSINDLSLLSESMPVEQSAHCHGVQKNHDPSQTIADLIAAQIKRSPDAVAIESKNCCMTYTVLDQRAQDLSAVLAKYLKRIHPAAGSPVIATCTHRSTSMVTALASVLRAGAVYLPLDPAYPADRIDYMLKDAGAGILITQSDIHENLSGFEGTVVLLDEQGQVTDVFPASSSTVLEPNVPATVEQSSAAAPNAYLIYTSGSTGQPKGVVISQRSVVNFLLSMAEEPGLSAGDRLLAVTTPSFDIAVLELFLPLIRGGTVIVAESEVVADGHRLAALIESSRPTIMQATPATWRMLVNTGWQPDSSLRILCGGEALDPGLARQLTAAAGEVWNMYGPTETTIWSTCALVDAQATRISIGKPIANTSVYVLDARMQPVPVGVCGELYIGGEGVAEGYHNRDVLTAERFVADPFKAGGRLYRTGDRARYLHNGSLELLGRLDRQISC